ncbi:hypothetical protein [Phenylobacterium sp.]|uniref:hypothetical protein n=1 Tax=Phenylobacterium sp. TaxID=1871053 RepID=UPI0037CA9E49
MFVLLWALPAAARECDRACAGQAAEAALAALQTGQAGKVLPRGVRITENGRDIRLADSQLFAIRQVTARQTYSEPQAGAVGIIGAAEAYGGPAIFALRVKLKGDRVSEIETLVVRRTEAQAFSPGTFRNLSVDAAPKATAFHSARLDLITVANAWLDGFSGAPAGPDPAASDCVLFDNGARSPSPSACRDLAALRGPIRERRLALFDEEQGVVWAWAIVDHPEAIASAGRPGRSMARSVLLAARLRIDRGQIQDIELVQRNLTFGATSGWGPPKPKKRT